MPRLNGEQRTTRSVGPPQSPPKSTRPRGRPRTRGSRAATEGEFMRRTLVGLALLCVSACYLPPPQQGSAPPPPPPPQQQGGVTVVTPPPAPAPAAFSEADNANWMRSLKLELALGQRVFAPGQPVFAQITLSDVSNVPVP